MTPIWLKQTPSGITLSLHCQPGAKQTKVLGLHDDCLKIALQAPPLENKANALLVAKELKKVGAVVEEGADYIVVNAPASVSDWKSPSEGIDTYDDHRMAMCFSLASFGPNALKINDPNCVAKTFPTYFSEFATVVT